MAFEISPLEIEDLLETFVAAEQAFSAFNRLIYSVLPLSTTTRERIVTSQRETLTDNPHSRAFKAVDPNTGRIVGSARWFLYEEDQVIEKSVEEIVAGRVDLDLPEMRKDVARAFFTLLYSGRQEILGIREGGGEVVKTRKCLELVSIFVHPEYQRQGIARAFLQWGVDEAERLGLPIYLEATEAGRPVYEKFGFERVEVVPFDVREFGVDEPGTQFTFMIRPPKGN